jgi:2-oxoglutarate ferredoxin oxidoreductase subunit gamma
MQLDCVIAGFGGQGILLMGKILAQAAMGEGLQTTFLPSYGPEMRGGTANCSVVIADALIASPVVDMMDVLVALNQQSYDKFLPRMRGGGLLLINESLVHTRAPEEKQLRVCGGGLTDIAGALGDVRFASMVALGCFVRATGIVPLDAVAQAMRELTAKRPELHAQNESALQRGFALAHQ